ncbi:biogenesis of lysosome-related organelles complex 1 subunit Cnl1p [[Candida] railenensis]|uniref:Biogenesis of lysosome-related organelles complex 1 subunit CNL1 n=1 Tax=[Candida] railenensis TaxID=45579 RepID=A0A9P0QSM4_9ASCO|nr:biogenesis of lysosome-related organelles complex 1 subunit Cnl1p [[Candida] railenensis]
MEVDEEDPLGLRNLAVQYDYLMFKINDRLSTLSDQTYQSVISKQNAIENNYIGDQLKLTEQIKEIDDIILSCKEIELELMKLDQIESFVSDFKERVVALEEQFSKLM